MSLFPLSFLRLHVLSFPCVMCQLLTSAYCNLLCDVIVSGNGHERCQSILPLCYMLCACQNCIWEETEKKKQQHFPCFILLFPLSYPFTYHPINSLTQTIILCVFAARSWNHTHTTSRYTQINRPWQGCVSRWQRWREHGHRAVSGVALHEVNHPDTLQKTGTVPVPLWWCGLVTTGQKKENVSHDLNRLNVHANPCFDLELKMKSNMLVNK